MSKVNSIIRNVHPSDLPYLYNICLKTGANGDDATALFQDLYMVGQYYAAPYVFYEPDICFVAEKEGEHIPLGYVLGASDSHKFYKWMDETWLKEIRLRYTNGYKPETPQEHYLYNRITDTGPYAFDSDMYRNEYPAHMHIDILPELQHTGCGRRLVEAFLDALRKKNVPGIHLGVSSDNLNAQGFYKKLGFSVLEGDKYGMVLGMKL